MTSLTNFKLGNRLLSPYISCFFPYFTMCFILAHGQKETTSGYDLYKPDAFQATAVGKQNC